MRWLQVVVLALLVSGVALAAEDGGSGLTVKDSFDFAPSQGHLDGVVFRPLFPESENLRFVAGEVAELCLGFVNTLDRLINFTHVEASLRSIYDEKEVVQNFTRQFYGINTPGSGTSVAIDYRFRPDPMLDAIGYVLVVEVQYRDGNINHTETVFNSTIHIVEPDERVLNLETIFLVVGGGGALAAIFYVSKQYLQKKVLKKRGESSLSSEEKRKKDESFLEGTKVGGNRKSPKK